MATFQDNINTINTAVYGKEMRPAISEALTQSWNAVKIMMGSVDQLNARIDSLPSGGGSPEDPDKPMDPIPTGSYIVSDTIECFDGVITELVAVDNADPF